MRVQLIVTLHALAKSQSVELVLVVHGQVPLGPHASARLQSVTRGLHAHDTPYAATGTTQRKQSAAMYTVSTQLHSYTVSMVSSKLTNPMPLLHPWPGPFEPAVHSSSHAGSVCTCCHSTGAAAGTVQ